MNPSVFLVTNVKFKYAFLCEYSTRTFLYLISDQKSLNGKNCLEDNYINSGKLSR